MHPVFLKGSEYDTFEGKDRKLEYDLVVGFSYMPNARAYKATIAARLCGVNVEIRAAPPLELKDWLWDFNAGPMTERDKKIK